MTPALSRCRLALALLLASAAAGARAETLGDLRPSWSPDGQSLVFQSTRDGNDEIYRLDLATGAADRLTRHTARDAQPSWSPDGRQVVFVSDRDRDAYSGRAAFQIYVMNADGSDARRLIASDSADFLPRWSPDGRTIAFLSDRSGELRLYAAPSAGGEARPLLPPELAGTPGNPAWSPDGRRLAFDLADPSGYDIYSLALDTGEVVNHTRSPEREWYPAWSPDGTKIVAGVLTGTRDAGTHTLVAIDLATGERRAVTRPTPRSQQARDWWPTWSPDGSRIAFASRRDGPWKLFVIHADGSGERPLTP